MGLVLNVVLINSGVVTFGKNEMRRSAIKQNANKEKHGIQMHLMSDVLDLKQFNGTIKNKIKQTIITHAQETVCEVDSIERVNNACDYD